MNDPARLEGGPKPELDAETDQVKRDVVLELVGFFVIITCMILMRLR